jgi:Arc/MetJ family transcription regulator
MRTNIIIDDDLLSEAAQLSTEKTKCGIIHEALRFFVVQRKKKKLSELAGKIKFRSGYNYKSARS